METLGKYTLLKKLATGGMAEIWLATTSVSGVRRVCVVKRILPHLAEMPDFVRMFFDEARLVATLTHENIAQLYDVGDDAGRPFIAMEYLHGADLRALKRALRGRAPARVPLEHAIHVGIGAAAGLHYAHEKIGLDGRRLNIVHRDISPQNLFVTYDGAVKVLDFGIAKSDGRVGETEVGTLKGKVPYMSPEQCACAELDRQSDIYSLGVVLYELTTGHRVHPLGASEYEMIRAIVDGAVAPPTTLDPAFPKALEAIILRCLEKERRRRYPTARALQADLDAFAREERMAVSSLALSSYMAELFGKRAEAWREALAGGEARLLELAERSAADADAAPPRGRAYGALLEGRARAVAPDPRPAARSSIAPAALNGDAAITARRVGELSVIAVAGKLNERFAGAALAERLVGRVVVDLSGVTRVTSFGVRAWLEAMSDATARAAEVFFCRCAEPIVNQMSMIKGFAGGGRVVSFHAPYRCGGCGASWRRVFDCEHDAEPIQKGEAPDADCPSCGAISMFDDDPRSYLAFAAPFTGSKVPLDVRAAIDELARADGRAPADAIEKTIDGRTTRITVRAAIDANMRWKRVLDGLEGDLEIDLGGAPSATPEGAAALCKALGALGPEVDAIVVRGCPRSVAEALIAGPDRARLTLASVVIEGRCAACDAARTALLRVADLGDGRAPHALCKRCEAPLAFPDAPRFFAGLAALAGRGRLADDEPDVPSNQPDPAPDAKPPRGRALFAAAAIAAAVAIVVVLIRLSKPIDPPVAAPRPSAAAAPKIAAATTPPWADRPITIDADAVFAVGAGEGATAEIALAAARDDALDRLAAQLLDDLGDAPLALFCRARAGDGRRAEARASVAARYLAEVGAIATPTRADAHVQRRGAELEAFARYRLDKGAYAAALAFYRATARVGGATIAPVFPLLERALRTTGAAIAIAVDKGSPAAIAGVREGDAVLAIDGRPVASIGALAGAPEAAELRLEAGGVERVVKLGAR